MMHVELMKASDYYKNRAPGWVAVCNGQPLHFPSKREAVAAAKEILAKEVAA